MASSDAKYGFYQVSDRKQHAITIYGNCVFFVEVKKIKTI